MQSKKTKIEALRRPSTTGWKNWRIGLISVFSVVMVAVGLCTVLIFHRGTRPEIHPDVGGLVALATKLHAAETSRDGVTRVVRIDEREANSFLAARVASFRHLTGRDGNQRNEDGTQYLDLRDLRVKLIDDRVNLSAEFAVQKSSITMDFRGRLRTADGYIQFDPINGRVGALPIPAAVMRVALNEIMNSETDRKLLRLPEELSDMRVKDGQLIVTYK